MALSSWTSLSNATNFVNRIQQFGAWFKGVGEEEWYALEVDPVVAALPVTIVGAVPTTAGGLTPLSRASLDLAATPVTSGAWVELIANVGASAVIGITIDESYGAVYRLGIGAAAAEVDLLYIPEGGFHGIQAVSIAAGSRLSVRLLYAAASPTTGGYFTANFLRA